MNLGFDLKKFVTDKRRESIKENNDKSGDGVLSGQILGGRRRSILEVAGAIRTGVRLGSITKETAHNSESF